MAYPDTDLRNDALDAEYGGQPASGFGQPAFMFIHSVLRFLSQAYLTYVRQPYKTVVAVSQSSAAAGDVAVFVAGEFVPSSGYAVRKYTSGLSSPYIYGLYLEPVSAGSKSRVAIGGIVPPSIVNLGTRGSADVVGLDTSTGRLRIAQTGDVVLGAIDLQGNILFSGFGVAAP